MLLLGASGFFGPVLAAQLGRDLLAQTYRNRPIAGGIRFDAATSSIREIVNGLKPRPATAVVLFAETGIDACAADPVATAKINVEAAVRAIRELSDLKVVPVFSSSDAVFDGARSYWKEKDDVRPILTYGRQKLEVEKFMTTLRSPWLVVRLPKMDSIITEWISNFESGKQIRCATDNFFTVAAASDVARAITMLIRDRAQGLYHLGGPERLSRRELLQVVFDEYCKFDTPKAEIVECSLRDFGVPEVRPLDTSMSSDKFTSRYGPMIRPSSEIARLAVRTHFEKKSKA